MQKVQEEYNMAILFITHDLGVVAEIADDVAVMYLGNVVEYTDVDTAFNNPKHPYTRALLRSMPKVTATREPLQAIKGMVPSPLPPTERLRVSPALPRFYARRLRPDRPADGRRRRWARGALSALHGAQHAQACGFCAIAGCAGGGGLKKRKVTITAHARREGQRAPGP